MDLSEAEALWKEVTALRARVASLELQLSRNSPPVAPPEQGSASSVRGTGERGEAPLSFVPPPKPSLESRIGSQLFNRVGIVAVLVGAAWFLKYAVDQHWLGPAARVCIGLLAGLGLLGWSERFRRRQYPVFSFSLKAVGTGLLYLSLWASFSLFHLVSYPVAFAGMVVVTVVNAWMCWVQRSEVLAAFAAIGGFLTPSLLPPQHTSVLTLGSYLLLLNAGLFALLLLRRWPSLLVAAFTGTSTYLAGMAWHAPALWAGGEAEVALGLVSLFFVVFSLAPGALAGMGEDSGGRTMARAVALFNAVLGSLELWRLLPGGSFARHWLLAFVAGWFAGLLVAGRFLTSLRTQAALASLYAGFVIAFAAGGIWTGLHGGGVVAGWALEAATLLLLTSRLRSASSLRSEGVMGSPLPAAGLLLGSAAALLVFSFRDALPGPVLFNERCGLFSLVIAVAVLGVRLAAGQHGRHRGEASLRQWTRMGAGSALLATTLLLLAGVLEIHAYWQGSVGTAERFWDSAWAAGLGVGLLVLGFRVRWAFLRWQALALLTLAVGKVFLVDTRALSQGFRILSFLGLGVLLLCVSFIYQRDLLHLRGEEHGG